MTETITAMTDTGPPTQVDDVPVVGQRRRDPSEAFPTRPDPSELSPLEQGDDQIGGGDGDGPVDPCADPVTALEWNADAAAAEATLAMKDFAGASHPSETAFNEREYGAVLWEMPDGSIVLGPITFSEHTFFEAAYLAGQGQSARPFVAINFAPPSPSAVHLGTIHSHGLNGFIPSGLRRDQGDQGGLTYSQTLREASRPGSGMQARLYVVANRPGSYETPGSPKITVYEERNRDSAMSGVEGPEVNPNGIPCS